MYHMHTLGASKCMHLVHSVGFGGFYLEGDSFNYTNYLKRGAVKFNIFPRGFAHEKVDVLNVLNKYLIKPSFGDQNHKPEELISFISIVEDFFPLR